MPDIHAFRGVLYNPEKVKDISKVVTEPYDVISPAGQKLYYACSPYNIIRLILGKPKFGDNSRNNWYARARQSFTDWQQQDILRRDQRESIYIYAQTFPHNDKKKTRTGFIVLLKLEDFAKNTILPHENTNSQAVQDRRKLLKTARANLSPIFAIFVDPQAKINKILSQCKQTHQPYIVIEKDKVLHRLWRMSDRPKIKAIQRLLKDKQIFIADGHHRYEAALSYKKEMQRAKKKLNQSAPYNYVMTYLVATSDPGLAILPTHRVVKIAEFKPKQIISDLKQFFKLQKFSTSGELFSYLGQQRKERVFGAYFEKNRFWGLKLKDIGSIYNSIDKSRHTLHKNLDAVILHSVIIERILKVAPSRGDIFYTRDAQEAIKLVEEQDYQAAFFLRAATVTQVKTVAKAGQRMPHKTTYFYPKALTGLVINKLG